MEGRTINGRAFRYIMGTYTEVEDAVVVSSLVSNIGVAHLRGTGHLFDLER